MKPNASSRKTACKPYSDNETRAAHQPLRGGPFKNFLAMLHRIQADYPAESSPIRTALVTARGAPAHERVIRTLRNWGIRIDESVFLAGMDKGPFLQALRCRHLLRRPTQALRIR